jgi:hypothetical protein
MFFSFKIHGLLRVPFGPVNAYSVLKAQVGLPGITAFFSGPLTQ